MPGATRTLAAVPVNLTAALLNARRARSVWPARLAVIADRLVAEHGRPSLGNFRDPVREVFYIMLSAKTADAQYRLTERRLHAKFPTLAALAAGRLSAIRACIESGGLAERRAVFLKAAARKLLALGPRPVKALRAMPPAECYRFLASLPGVGPKSALCVMMYSLGYDAFPVDVNVQRILERVGAHRPGGSHAQSQRWLAPLVPAGRSLDLHVGLVVHGRKVCLPRTPRCEACCLQDVCRTGRRKVAADAKPSA